jgi:hypothetical protein
MNAAPSIVRNEFRPSADDDLRRVLGSHRGFARNLFLNSSKRPEDVAQLPEPGGGRRGASGGGSVDLHPKTSGQNALKVEVRSEALNLRVVEFQ